MRADCEALWAFYTHLDDPGALDDPGDDAWGPNTAFSSWRGVVVDVDSGRVAALRLNQSKLSGPTSPELGQLTGLLDLQLWGNDLSGPIPPELGRLTNLGYLALDNNQLSGSIPPELGRLPALVHLDLSSNGLSGPIPPELGQLTNLTYLILSRNGLTGAIPPELGQLTNLKRLSLNGNDLSGPISPALGKLTNLENLRLDGNLFTGGFPSELSRFDHSGVVFSDDPLGLIAFFEHGRPYGSGRDRWTVWVCDTPGGHEDVDLASSVRSFRSWAQLYFEQLSGGLYVPEFVAGGTVQDTEEKRCHAEVRAAFSGADIHGAVIVTDTETLEHPARPGGVAGTGGPGGLCYTVEGIGSDAPLIEPKPDCLYPANSREVTLSAMSAVDGGYVLVHEIGHALAWPHSFVGPDSEGDNPMDQMSTGSLNTGTLAVNRYAAGWIAVEDVAVHPTSTDAGSSQSGALYELFPLGRTGTQMLVLPTPIRGVFYTLGARVRSGIDTDLPAEGVEIYHIDQSPWCTHSFLGACYGVERRTRPFVSGGARFEGVEHVHGVGSNIVIGDARVRVLERTADGQGYVVWVGPGPFAGAFFDDEGSVHEPNIDWLASTEITQGCDRYRFCPDRSVTRAQMMVFLARALRIENNGTVTAIRFSDVPDNAWYLPHLQRLAQLGVVEPYKDGTFRPSEPLSRADMAVFLTKAFPHITAVTDPAQIFEDVAADAPYAAEVKALRAAGITKGCSTDPLLYCPDEAISRAQMASLLARTLANTP